MPITARWYVSVAMWYALILAGQAYFVTHHLPGGKAVKLAYGLLFAGLGAGLLGALARRLPGTSPVQLRAMAMLGGALLAAVAVALAGTGEWRAHRLGLWMAALLGIGIAVMAARVLPDSWTARWLGRPPGGQNTSV